MKMMRWVVIVLLAAALAGAVVGWKNVARLRAENEALRAELQTLKDQAAPVAEAESRQRDQELQRLRAEAQEVVRLRGEVSQLRNGAKEGEKLRAENQRLQAENRQIRAIASAAPVTPAPAVSKDQFPKESWTFSGYGTPEAALVSAIWAMREGNPKTYAASLSPDEQARMAQVWANKSEAELAAKHQQDVSAISGMRILDRQTASPDEVVMSVYIEGVGRMEKVSMKRIGEEWKFGGFIRNPPK